MKKLVLLLIICFSGTAMMNAQEDTTSQAVKSNKIFSIGFITGFNNTSTDTWSLGTSLGAILYKKIGPYADFKYNHN